MTPLESSLRAFFEHYARTFHRDVEAFCDLYDFPSETVRLDGSVQRFNTKAEAALFFGLARKKYEDEQCAQWGIRTFGVEDRGSGSAVATVGWDMKNVDGIPIRGWTQTYEVIGGPTQWRVRRSRLHSGTEVAYPAPRNHVL